MQFINARNESYQPERWLTYDDVLMVPQHSRLKSRNDERITLCSYLYKDVLCNHYSYGDEFLIDHCSQSPEAYLNLPIISANMDTITGSKMAIEMSFLGGLGILHRFYKSLYANSDSSESYISEIEKVVRTGARLAFSVGVSEDWLEFIEYVINSIDALERDGYSLNALNHTPFVCLDIAHADADHALKMVRDMKNMFSDRIIIIAGNVCTGNAACSLAKAGADVIKVGVGPGAACSTRIVTGHGLPQLSAIMNCRESLDECMYSHVGIIADGGIRTSGDIVKALAVGADAVMLGGMISGTDETPGEIISTDDGSKKMYRGQSSRHFLNDIGKSSVASEGESMLVKTKGPLKNIIKEISGGIRSGLTYSGSASIYELQSKALFAEITQNGLSESVPHGLLGK